MRIGSRTRTLTHWSLVALGAFLLPGCADMVWVKPGTERLVASKQLDECRKQARLSASRMATAGTRTIPVPGSTTSGATTVLMPNPMPSVDVVEEQGYLNKCMRDKGYALVPVR